MRILNVVVLLFFSGNILLSAATTVSGSCPLNDAYDHFRTDHSLRPAGWSFYVTDITANEPIIAHNIHQRLLPASTQKLITTASALMLLGHDHRYETHLEYDGNINRRGVLEGNLYIRGSGDPTLGSVSLSDTLSLNDVFSQWHQSLKAAGITKVSGHIIADERIFDHEMVPRRWLWGHLGNHYGAGASGLTVMENSYTVYLAAGEALGAPAEVVSTDPVIPGLSFINELSTGPSNSGDQVHIFGPPYQQERRLTGTVPLGTINYAVKGSMPDPPKFIADAFKVYLGGQGIETGGETSTYRALEADGLIASDNRKILSTWHSPYLFDIIYRANTASINTYTENLLKTIGHYSLGQGTTEAGLNATIDLWDSLDVRSSQWRLHDGSGLSAYNRLSAHQLMSVMEAASRHPSFGVLLNSLPLAGYSGSIAHHFRGSHSEGVLRAKSGTLSNVLAYAGYTPMQNGHLAAFVIIVNDYDGSPVSMRNKMIRLLDTIILYHEN